MLKIFLATACITFLTCCRNEKSKKNHDGTYLTCGGNFVEYYKVYSGGVYGGDLRSAFLTDSVNFRILVGVYDDDQRINFECVGDTVFVLKGDVIPKFDSLSKSSKNMFKPIEKKQYSIKKLKESHLFE